MPNTNDVQTVLAAILAGREADVDGHTPDWLHVEEAIADLPTVPTGTDLYELADAVHAALDAHDAQH